MGDHHATVEKYSLSEHAQLRRSLHHDILLEHQRQGRIFLPDNFTSRLSSSAGEWALDEYYFLQPVPARQRRAMLHEAGVVRIDPTEREECRSLRASRGRCGCSCREVCRPPSCACFRSGIGCQVDQMAFPCACSRIGCSNPHGRVEFNAGRVRAHFIRTLLQLGLCEQHTAAGAGPDYDSGHNSPPAAKRCRIDDDHLPTTSLSSSSSLLVNNVNGASVSAAANGFELSAQAVYYHAAEQLLPPGPPESVVYDDDDYDEDGVEESSSETSSDSGNNGFDCGNSVSDHGGTYDSRQSTLDNYVVRYRRGQTTCTEPAVAASLCSIAGLTGGSLQLGPTESSLNIPPAPLSCTVTSLEQQSPALIGLSTAVYSTPDSVPGASTSAAYTNVTEQCVYSMSHEALYQSVPSEDNYFASVATTRDHTQSCYSTDNSECPTASDDHTSGCVAACSSAAVDSNAIAYNSPPQQGTICVYSTPNYMEHDVQESDSDVPEDSAGSGYSVPDYSSVSSCRPVQQNVSPSCAMLDDSTSDLSVPPDNTVDGSYASDISVMASCRLAHNDGSGICVSDSDCEVSCSPSNEMEIGNDARCKSEVSSDALNDQSFTEPCSVITSSSSNQLNSAVEPDDACITATENSRQLALHAIIQCSVSPTATEQTQPLPAVTVTSPTLGSDGQPMLSAIQNTESHTSCHAEGFEHTCDVSSDVSSSLDYV